MKLLGDTQRTALIAVTPKKESRHRDGPEHRAGVGICEGLGHESKTNWVKIRHDGGHLGRKLS